MDGVNGAGVSVPGTMEGVSNNNSVGKKGSPKKGQAFASFDVEEYGDAQGTKDDIVNVGIRAVVAVSDGFSLDQKRSKSDLVRSESRKREDPKIGSSWASIVEASSDEDEDASRSISSETAVADKVYSAVADDMDNNGGQSNFSSFAGKAWSANVAGSVVRKMSPARAWVKKGPTTGPDLCSRIAGSAMASGFATAGNQTGMVVGLITDFIPTSSYLRSPVPQRLGSGPFDEKRHPEVSLLGLGDVDFPPIRPLTDLGTTTRMGPAYGSRTQHGCPDLVISVFNSVRIGVFLAPNGACSRRQRSRILYWIFYFVLSAVVPATAAV